MPLALVAAGWLVSRSALQAGRLTVEFTTLRAGRGRLDLPVVANRMYVRTMKHPAGHEGAPDIAEVFNSFGASSMQGVSAATSHPTQ